MNIRTNSNGIEITPAISSYIEKKLVTIERFLNDNSPETMIEVEIGKDAKHRKGQGFRAEMSIVLPNKRLYATAEDDDMYAAIDKVKDEIVSELKKQNEKKRDVVRRSAARAKEMMRRFGSYLMPRRKSE